VHTWDIAVTLDDSARLLPDAVALLVDNLGMVVGWTGRAPIGPVTVRTTSPQRVFVLDGDERLALSPAGEADPTGDKSTVELPAEAFIRLVYGRLDPAHTPEIHIEGIDLDSLRAAFPGP
jgi:MDMPI C-terminal domain